MWCATVFSVFLACYVFFVQAPPRFPVGTLITIEEGTSIDAAAHLLEEAGVVRSSTLFSILTRFFSEAGVRSGTYSFEQRLSLVSVWHRTVTGETGEPLVRVTIPEGATTREMAALFEAALPGFDPVRFRSLAREKEGYLFPETYIVSPSMTEEALLALMEDTFYEKVREIEDEITAFGQPLEAVVIMASLLEKEARLYETRQTVAGILWKRLAIGMALQVDAVFGYIYDTDTFSPSFDQLTATDSPYNTYQYTGLPPGPIANPGLESLRAAVNPIETPYLYYLTGSDGTMHYASTFDEHVANRQFLR